MNVVPYQLKQNNTPFMNESYRISTKLNEENRIEFRARSRHLTPLLRKMRIKYFTDDNMLVLGKYVYYGLNSNYNNSILMNFI